MKQLILKTDNSLAPLVLRVFLGIVIFPHGAQKLFGWFGGHGFSGTMDYFINAMGLPWAVGITVIILESFGALAIVAGAATRLIAIALVGLALGIMLTSHSQYFFMNWFGNQTGEGMEYFLLWIGMATALIFLGSGRFSVDKLLANEQ